MKRQAFIKALSILPVALMQACQKSFPSTPTIVTGKVIDENNLPVEGVEFQFSGIYKKGISGGGSTFNLRTQSDKDGVYRFSQVIPDATDDASIKVESNAKFDFNFKYQVLFFFNGKYDDTGSLIPVQQSAYGTTVTLNFQIRKR